MNSYRKQSGITLVEFTIVASTILLIIFAILEVGYFTYSMQSLNDLTRRTARIATVCQVSDGTTIKSLALLEKAPNGFLASNLSIDYLDGDGNITTTHEEIKYVRTRVIDFEYGFSGILSFLGNNGVIDIPEFETVLPAESLGVERPGEEDESYTDCSKELN